MSRLNVALNSLSDGLKLINKELAYDFAKVYLLIYLVNASLFALLSIAILTLTPISINDLSIVFKGNFGIAPKILSSIWIILAISIPLYLIAGIVNNAVGSTIYNIIKNRSLGKNTKIIEQTKDNFTQITIFYIIELAISFTIFVPLLILLFNAMQSTKNPSSAFPFLIVFLVGVLAILFAVFVNFFLQFVSLEITLNKKTAINAIKSSINMVKKNLLLVIIFGVLLMFLNWGVAMLFGVFNQFLGVIMNLGFQNPIFLVLWLIIFVPFSFIESVIFSLVIIPPRYILWQKISQTVEKNDI
ncbi:MAG: hypothetical protein AABX38_02910 [Candidatus Micrarchaeota archaeon]